MSLLFDRYAFLQHFDFEKVIDEEVEIVGYDLCCQDLTLSVNIYPYDGLCFITIKHKKFEFLLVDIELSNIENIHFDQEKPDQIRLKFYKEKIDDAILTIMIKPNISLQCSL